VTIRIEAVEGYPDDDLVEKICTILSDQPPYPINIFEKQLKHQCRILGCYAWQNLLWLFLFRGVADDIDVKIVVLVVLAA